MASPVQKAATYPLPHQRMHPVQIQQVTHHGDPTGRGHNGDPTGGGTGAGLSCSNHKLPNLVLAYLALVLELAVNHQALLVLKQ